MYCILCIYSKYPGKNVIKTSSVWVLFITHIFCCLLFKHLKNLWPQMDILRKQMQKSSAMLQGKCATYSNPVLKPSIVRPRHVSTWCSHLSPVAPISAATTQCADKDSFMTSWANKSGSGLTSFPYPLSPPVSIESTLKVLKDCMLQIAKVTVIFRWNVCWKKVKRYSIFAILCTNPLTQECELQ